MVARAIPAPFYLPSAEFTAAYLNLGLVELRRRAEEGLELLRSCEVCPRNCRVNRLDDKFAVCKTGRYAIVSSFFPHFGEEDCLRGWSGSGTVFFSMCNLRCSFCLSPDTRVATDRGLQRIEDLFNTGSDEVGADGGSIRVLPGVQAFTRTGTLARIAKVFRHPHTGDLVAVKPVGLPPMVLTPNHSVFASTDLEGPPRKVQVAELTRSHFLILPKLRIVDHDLRDIDVRSLLQLYVSSFRRSLHRRAPVRTLQEFAAGATRGATYRTISQTYAYHPAHVRTLMPRLRRGLLTGDTDEIRNELVEKEGWIRFKTEKGPGIPARLPLDRRLASLLGYFCAEGHISTSRSRPNSHRAIFSFGRHESALVDLTRTLLEEIVGVTPSVVRRRTTITVEAGNTSLALFLKRLCGTGARNKCVPPPVFTAPAPVVRAFLDAYVDGDGSRGRYYLSANTVSEELAHGLVFLLLRLGIFPYFYATPRSATPIVEDRRVRQSETLYCVKCRREGWEGRKPAKAPYRETDEAFWVPIRSLSRISYDGPVYNLEIDDGDHSYLASGIAVGNCQNYDISQLGHGRVVTPDQLAAMMLHLQETGCHNINFVTPEHVVPQILEALPTAVEHGLRLPLVYNTSSYDSTHSLRLLDGIVDIYMPDFKFWDREGSRLYLKAPDYPEHARRTIKEMHRQVGELKLDECGLARRGVLIRHLVMPGRIAGTEEIMQWIAGELSVNSYVNVMAQYSPAGRVGTDTRYNTINRRITAEEVDEAVRAAHKAGLHRLDMRLARHPQQRWAQSNRPSPDP